MAVKKPSNSVREKERQSIEQPTFLLHSSMVINRNNNDKSTSIEGGNVTEIWSYNLD